MKTHFTILADDLSGAADCAVPFARAGFLTLPIVMKADAFGTSPTLLNVVHFLRTFKK